MGIVRKYIEEGGGNFLTVKNCALDATVTIKTVKLDDQSFDKSYIVIGGVYDPSGEDCNVRLGGQNLTRIAEVLGDDETTWPGQQLVSIGTQKYPGLGTSGLLWSGMKGGRREVAPSADVGGKTAPSIDVFGNTVNKILAAKPDMTRNAVVKLIDEEKAKAAGLLTVEAAAYLVASNLGVK